MKRMNSRKRVKKALCHQKPDRIPRYEIFLPDFVERWREKKQMSPDASIYDAYPCIDIGTVLATQTGPFLKQVYRKEDGNRVMRRDSWGRIISERKGAALFEVIETAVQNKSVLDSLEFENPADPARPDMVTVEKRLISTGSRFAPVSGVMGLFMPAYYLRGETVLMMDLVDDSGFCHALIERIAEYITVQGEAVLRLTDTWDTALWVYDDFSSSRGPLISPAMFEKFFVPAYRRMTDYWKNLGAKNIILHHDGNCWSILDLIVAAGFTGIQGIYPGAGMTIPDVKAAYGSQLCLIGGMCNTTVLASGSAREIERQVEEIAEVARDGGVIIGAHSIDKDVSSDQYNIYNSCLNRFDFGM